MCMCAGHDACRDRDGASCDAILCHDMHASRCRRNRGQYGTDSDGTREETTGCRWGPPQQDFFASRRCFVLGMYSDLQKMFLARHKPGKLYALKVRLQFFGVFKGPTSFIFACMQNCKWMIRWLSYAVPAFVQCTCSTGYAVPQRSGTSYPEITKRLLRFLCLLIPPRPGSKCTVDRTRPQLPGNLPCFPSH